MDGGTYVQRASLNYRSICMSSKSESRSLSFFNELSFVSNGFEEQRKRRVKYYSRSVYGALRPEIHSAKMELYLMGREINIEFDKR